MCVVGPLAVLSAAEGRRPGKQEETSFGKTQAWPGGRPRGPLLSCLYSNISIKIDQIVGYDLTFQF